MASRTENHILWEQRLQERQDSEQSAMNWCKEQNITYPTFCYWKTKFKTPVPEKVAFEELQEPFPSAIELRWGEVRLFLSKDFDIATLERCLIALRRAQC